MSRPSSPSLRLWLVATLFGLGALLPAVAAQGSSAEQHLLREDAPVLATPQSAVLPGKESVLPGSSRHGSHALLRTSSPASLFGAARFLAPTFYASATAHESASAIACAPRTTGPSRAPPAA